jgi:hypothetical protein
MPKDVIVVPHPEFGRFRHELSIAAERFNRAAKQKHGSLAFIGSLQTITSEDRQELLQQIEVERVAYNAIMELDQKILRLLGENDQAKGATNHR